MVCSLEGNFLFVLRLNNILHHVAKFRLHAGTSELPTEWKENRQCYQLQILIEMLSSVTHDAGHNKKWQIKPIKMVCLFQQHSHILSRFAYKVYCNLSGHQLDGSATSGYVTPVLMVHAEHCYYTSNFLIM